MSFTHWLTACAEIALESEWIIDANMPEWGLWWRANLTPRQAVQRLYVLINEET